MQQEGYHHVNMLVAHLRQDMVSRDTSILTMVQEFAAVATEDKEQIDNPPLSQTVNAVSQDTMQLKMLRILRDM